MHTTNEIPAGMKEEIPAGMKGTLKPDVYTKQSMPGHAPSYPTGVTATYRSTELLMVAFTTDEEKAAALLPEQLQLVKIPQLPGQAAALAIFANYRENDHVGPYLEVIISIPVLHKGQLYTYIPYIYVDTDSAMTAGRGYRKRPPAPTSAKSCRRA